MKVNRIYQGNCVAKLAELDADSVDLAVTSPPYDDLRAYKGYEFSAEAVLRGLHRVVKKGGVVVWNVADATKDGGRTLTSFEQAIIARDMGFKVHDVMIWHKPNPPYQHPGRYTNAIEYIFVFSKGKPKTFNGDRVPCKGVGSVNPFCRSTADGHKQVKGKTAAVKETKAHDNVWPFLAGRAAVGHPASFPIELPLMAVRTWTRKGDLVLDPMNGSGTTCLAAKQLGRDYIGFDISKEYCELARARLRKAVPLLGD